MRRPVVVIAGSVAALLAVTSAAVAVVDNDPWEFGSRYGMHAMMDRGTPGDADPARGFGHPMHGEALTSEFGYLTEMVAHHEEAITAAAELQRSDRPEMRAFGESIVASQTAQVEQMRTWLTEWYPDRRTEADYQPIMRDLSGLSGDELDRVFLEDMVPHHMMAVMMSHQLLLRGVADHPEVDSLARSIGEEQHAEILWMQRKLASWFDGDSRLGMGPGMGHGHGPGVGHGMGHGHGPGVGHGTGHGMGR